MGPQVHGVYTESRTLYNSYTWGPGPHCLVHLCPALCHPLSEPSDVPGSGSKGWESRKAMSLSRQVPELGGPGGQGLEPDPLTWLPRVTAETQEAREAVFSPVLSSKAFSTAALWSAH